MSDIRRKAVRGLQVGDSLSVSRTFTGKDVKGFAEISRDHNPVHFSKQFARGKTFDGCICHGLLVATMLTEIGGQLGWLASNMDIRFLKPVYPGNTVVCTLTIIEIDERNRAKADVQFINESGLMVIEANLAGILPNEEEKKMMGSLLTAEETALLSKPVKKRDPREELSDEHRETE